MKLTKISKGNYKGLDSQGTWISRNIILEDNTKIWVAFSCDCLEDCSDLNSWGESFKTLKTLKKFRKQFI